MSGTTDTTGRSARAPVPESTWCPWRSPSQASKALREASQATDEAQPMDGRSRWIALYVLCTGMLMVVLDATIVNVALPSIQDDLGFSASNLTWVVNGYLMAFGSLLLLAGRLGDLISRRRVFLIGLGVFTAASLLCGLAQSQEVLIGARFLQGIGGAMTSAVILGMIVTMFPEPKERAKAIGVYSFVAAGGGSIGLLLGGVLTEALDWHWIFFVNVPIGIVAGVLAVRVIGRDEGIGFGEGADALGALLITGSLMLLVYTIVKPAADRGWGDVQTLGLGAIAFGLLAAFILRESRARSPLIPLRIFRIRNVSGANAVQALMVAGFFSLFFLGALYMERVLGYSALKIGLAFLPVAVVVGALSLGFAERLQTRFGAKATLLPGLVLALAGLLLFARVPVDADYVVDMLPAMLLLGTGFGLALPMILTLAMSGSTDSDAGLASGLVNTTMQVGGALGLAVLSTLSTSRTENRLAEGASTASALTSGYHLAFAIGAGLVAASIVVAATVLKQAIPAKEAEDVAEGEPPLAEAA
jgi:EmrB/QacA subfamily drug resistance transporter